MSDPSDRRAAERFPVNQDTACNFVSPVDENFGPARIKNVSTGGVGLIVTKKVEVGALLADADRRSSMAAVLATLARPEAAGAIVDLLEQHARG